MTDKRHSPSCSEEPCDTVRPFFMDFFRPANARKIAFLVASLTTILFFYPVLFAGGRHASFVFALGDTWHLLASQLSLSGFFAGKGVFSGIDIFTHGGASDFFLRINLPIYEPFVLLFSAFARHSNPSLALLYVFMFAAHAFASTYFLHRLCHRFLHFDLSVSTFIAVGYGFGIPVINTYWYLPFALIAWMLPVAIYAAFAARSHFSPITVIAGSLPTFLIFTAGYIPLGLITTAISILSIVAFAHNSLLTLPRKKALRELAKLLAPCALATLVIAPYYAAAIAYYQTSDIANRPGADDIAQISYAMAETPRFFLRGLAANQLYEGDVYEENLFWGLIAVLIAILYIWQYPSRPASAGQPASPARKALLIGSFAAYLFFALAIFGALSPLSTIMYYFVPIAGKLHVYQRYLMIAHLFFMFGIAVMLEALALDPRRRAAKIMLAITALLLVASIHLTGVTLPSHLIVTEPLIIELVFAVLFLLCVIISANKGIIWSATLFSFLVSLQVGYTKFSDPDKSYAKMHDEQLVFSPAALAEVTQYLHHSSSKAIIKYVDLVPGIWPYLSKNAPWLLTPKIKLSSYYGYESHLCVSPAYSGRAGMQIPETCKSAKDDCRVAYRPDWEWLKLTGADFVLFEDGAISNDPHLAAYADLRDFKIHNFTNKGKVYTLAPLKFSPLPGDPIVFDNGYVRIRSKDETATVSNFKTNDAGNIKFQVESKQPAIVEYLFWPNKHLIAQIDGSSVQSEEKSALMTFKLPAGQHRFAMTYRNISQQLFLIFYLLYAATILIMGLLFLLRRMGKPQSNRFALLMTTPIPL